MTSNLLKRTMMTLGAVLLIAATAGAQMEPPGAANAPDNGVPQQENGGNAQGGGPGDATGGPTEQDHVDLQALKDNAFVKGVMRGSMTDTRLAQLALEKSSSEDVKRFARKVIADSTKLSGEMSRAARKDHVHPSAKLSHKDKELIARLRSLSGAEFDRAFIRVMVRRSKGADAAFKTEAERSRLDAVREVAGRGAPVIADRLETARQLAAAHQVWGPNPSAAATPASNPSGEKQ